MLYHVHRKTFTRKKSRAQNTRILVCRKLTRRSGYSTELYSRKRRIDTSPDFWMSLIAHAVVDFVQIAVISTVLHRIDLLFSWSVFDSTFILLEHCAIRIYFHLYWFVWCSLCHALTCRWLSLHNFLKNMHLHVKLFLIPCFFVRKIG